MKTYTILKLFVISLTLAMPTTSWARLLASLDGRIDYISVNSIVVGDMGFKLSSTVKIYSSDMKPISLKQLKSGDTVRIDIHQVGRKRFVDSIQLIKPAK